MDFTRNSEIKTDFEGATNRKLRIIPMHKLCTFSDLESNQSKSTLIFVSKQPIKSTPEVSLIFSPSFSGAVDGQDFNVRDPQRTAVEVW